MKTEKDIVMLSHALRELKKQWPSVPSASVRAAVREGKIWSRKSSEGSRARYFVKMVDIHRWIHSNDSK